VAGEAEIDVDLKEFPAIAEKLNQYGLQKKDKSNILKAVGQLIIMQTQGRFETKKAPDGEP
jgi:uncharacterized Rmd1/YagE family protein